MLQQILADMYVDPDILEALNDEQKKTLFLKMREEQVRRWKEREDKEEREGRKEKPRLKKASYKKVSWLLGRDGDVHVCIIGDSDDLKSHRLILSELRGQNAAGFNKAERSQTSGLLRSSLDAQKDQPDKIKPGIELLLKRAQEIDQSSNNSIVLLKHQKHDFDTPDTSDFITNQNNDLQIPESYVMDRNLSIADRLNQRALQKNTKDQLPIKEKLCSQATHKQDKGAVNEQEISSSYGGRVAQLRRNFNTQNAQISSPCAKPPIPTKPAHLLTAASVR